MLKLNLQYFAEGGEGGEGAAPNTGNVSMVENSGSNHRTTELNEQENDKYAEYLNLIKGEYKEQHQRHFQEAFNKRYGEYKSMAEKMLNISPILDALQQRYQTKNGTPEELLEALNNDDDYFEQAADAAGLTVEQLKHMRRIEAENQRYQRERRIIEARLRSEETAKKWQSEAEEVKKIYPTFDFRKAMENERFKDLMNPKNNIDMRTAYEVAFIDDIKNSVAMSTAQQTQKDVVNNILARGQRPAENGVSSRNGVVIQNDPSKWTKKNRDEIERKVLAGAKIKL